MAWAALWGTYEPKAQSIWPPRIVQFVNWHDMLIAVDSEGKLYQMRPANGGLIEVQLLMHNPVGY